MKTGSFTCKEGREFPLFLPLESPEISPWCRGLSVASGDGGVLAVGCACGGSCGEATSEGGVSLHSEWGHCSCLEADWKGARL